MYFGWLRNRVTCLRWKRSKIQYSNIIRRVWLNRAVSDVNSLISHFTTMDRLPATCRYRAASEFTQCRKRAEGFQAWLLAGILSPVSKLPMSRPSYNGQQAMHGPTESRFTVRFIHFCRNPCIPSHPLAYPFEGLTLAVSCWLHDTLPLVSASDKERTELRVRWNASYFTSIEGLLPLS